MAPHSTTTTTTETTTNRKVVLDRLEEYTEDDVAKHNTLNDAWCIVDNYVYDITNWIPKHPGGKVIAQYAGYNASDAYHMVHRNAYAAKELNNCKIGVFVQTRPKRSLDEDFRALRSRLRNMGLFKYSMVFFTAQILHVIALFCAAWYLINKEPFSYAAACGYLLLGYAGGQAGWMQHDLGHNSVFKSYRANRIWHRFVIGFAMGGASGYWRNAHWKHHLYTNIHGLDHDIDTLPLFAWTRNQLRKAVFPQWVHTLQSYYWYIFGPTLSFNYISYLAFLFTLKKKLVWDMAFYVAHFVAYYYFIGAPSVWWAVLTRLYVFGVSGVYMGHMFSLNHFAMDMYEYGAHSPEDIVAHQVITTRNVDQPAIHHFWHYLSGGLGYQIEHHLFPMMPRYNLPTASVYVKEFCKAHNLNHVTVGVLRAFMDVKKTLDEPHVSHEPADKTN